ncbi:MAG: cytochrome d ubiquinol oxidase subunit II [Candidatus Eisenbacteria bacterium]
MADLWYAIVAGLLTVFVLLDGYDFGAGMLHRWVARSDDERRRVIAAIGPFWDGNEVWLLAAGGALFMSFPAVLAAGLSGFYFAIFLVIWCLGGRGLSVEFRSHVADPMWRSFWDTVFMITSLLLALFFGVALGNVVRGVPLGADGWFALPLFTHFGVRGAVGILDWYTLTVGLFACGALAVHGAAFLAVRTDGAVRDRARWGARFKLVSVTIAWPLVTWATAYVRPDFVTAFAARPLAWGCVALAAAGIATAHASAARRADVGVFAGSAAFLAGLLGATAACAWPALLHAIPDAGRSLTTANAASPAGSLRGALAWYLPGLLLAFGYVALLAWLHRGKARGSEYGGAE